MLESVLLLWIHWSNEYLLYSFECITNKNVIRQQILLSFKQVWTNLYILNEGQKLPIKYFCILQKDGAIISSNLFYLNR